MHYYPPVPTNPAVKPLSAVRAAPAARNSNWYEVALVGPDCPNSIPPVYACGYSDLIDCIDADGTVPVPDGPGLGVRYDRDFINSHAQQRHVYEPPA